MSTGGLYLDSGESIVLTTDRISVDDIVYDAMLTNRRLILIDSRHARFEPRTTSLKEIQSVKSGRAATGEPVIILILKGEESAPDRKRIIIFQQEPLENRRDDRNLWLKKFIELCVSGKEPVVTAHTQVQKSQSGMHPSVRRWVAPDIVRPRPENFPTHEPVPRIEILEDESSILPLTAPHAVSLPEKSGPADSAITDAGTGNDDEHVEVPADKSVSEEDIRVTEKKSAEVSSHVDDPENDRRDTASFSDSILAATRAIIAARAQEELAHPSRPLKITKTSSIPEIPVQQTPEYEPEDTAVVLSNVPDYSTPDKPEEIMEIIETPEISSEIPDKETARDQTIIPEPEEEIVEEITDTEAQTLPSESQLTETISHGKSEDRLKTPENTREKTSVNPPVQRPGHLIAAATALVCLLILVIAFVSLSGQPPAETGTLTSLPTPLPTLPPPISATNTESPSTTAAYSTDTGNGVYIRISYDGQFTAEAGNPGFMQIISGQGSDVKKVLYETHPVSVTATKPDNSGKRLTVEIIKDGRIIASHSTTAPMGSVSLLIDPLTEQPPGLVTTVPTIASSPATGSLEYL